MMTARKPWIRGFKHKDGSWGYWINDVRNGDFVSIPAGATREEAACKLQQYLIRRELEKAGYDDHYAKEVATEIGGRQP
jgi:hypothetical protein